MINTLLYLKIGKRQDWLVIRNIQKDQFFVHTRFYCLREIVGLQYMYYSNVYMIYLL